MFEPTKLHPITYLSKIFKALKDNVFSIGIALFLGLKNGIDIDHIGDIIFPLILLLLTLVSVVKAVIESIRTTYWIEDDKLVLKSGVLSTHIKELYISRIQSIEMTKNIINQIFGGVIVEIKTPGDGIKLDTVSKQSAEALTRYLEQQKQSIEIESDDITAIDESSNFDMVYQLKSRDILLMSVTSGAMGTVLAVIWGLYGQIDELFDLSFIFEPIKNMFENEIIVFSIIPIVTIIISYIIGIFVTALKYFNYQLMYDGERLKIKYGLFEVKEKMLVVQQIQAVSEENSFLRQLIGYTSYKVKTTSDADFDEEDVNLFGVVEVLPFIRRREGRAVMEQLIPHYNYSDVERVIPGRALRRYIQWPLLFVIVLSGLIQYYLFDRMWIVGIVLGFFVILSSWMRYKYSGYRLSGDQLTMRTVGLLMRKTVMMKEDKIIEVALVDHYFTRRAKLATIKVKTAAGSISSETKLSHVDVNDAERIYQWLMDKEEQQYAS